MLEIGLLAGTVLLLGATVFALRIRRGEDDEPTTRPTPWRSASSRRCCRRLEAATMKGASLAW